MELIYLGVALVAVVVLAVLVAWALRARRKPRRLAYTTEEKALHQLAPLRDSLRSLPAGQYAKQRRRYQKRLRVALAVYAFERYGITVRDTIHASSIEGAVRGARGRGSLQRLKGLFDEANRLSAAADHDPSDMLSLYDSAVGFLTGRDTPEEQPDVAHRSVADVQA
ncbi:MAG: hypothetical protein GF331_04925 [Chitinivibrionales bacterium]|nr:hypothetical protein [Chitinivibrionales bacterium]